MKKSALLLVALAGLPLFAWQAAPSPLMTRWGKAVTPENAWREYPRPQMVRANWTNLNGEWDWQVTSVTNTFERPAVWAGKILVPYAIESALSGVGRLTKPDELLWYTRTITCNPARGKRILLHFGGCDFRTMVFIGHKEVTDVPHEGGQNPFTLDITDYVKPGANELTVCVWDPTDEFINPRGKQCQYPQGCFYTRVTGIWQTVWTEEVPESYIDSYTVVPDIDKGTVTFAFKSVGHEPEEDVKIEVLDADGRVVAKGKADATEKLVIKMPAGFKLWSPEEPNLYMFRARFNDDDDHPERADAFTGYFGMRKFSKGKDAKGVLRFFLNNKPYFPLGTLDQGWWPDGLLTPPSEEAMKHDILTLKSCGFNMMRKHIKVEPLRYYYLCDTLGLLVLQDMPSSNDDAVSFIRPTMVWRYGQYRLELKEMLDTLYNVPSIVMWVPYNEGWSQPNAFLTHSTFDFVKRYDPSRLVNGPSGWQDFEGGEWFVDWRKALPSPHRAPGACEGADTVDKHEYRGPAMLAANANRISFLGEFGGLGHPVSGHLWKESKDGNWGYGGIEDTKTPEGLQTVYASLYDKMNPLVEVGLSGSVYTQTTDVEIEINGVMTYDRAVLKYDPAKMRAVHAKTLEVFGKAVR